MTKTRREFIGLVGVGLAAGALPIHDIVAAPESSPSDQMVADVGYVTSGPNGPRTRALNKVFFDHLAVATNFKYTVLPPRFANWKGASDPNDTSDGSLASHADYLFQHVRIVVAADSLAAITVIQRRPSGSTVPIVVALSGNAKAFAVPGVVAFSDQEILVGGILPGPLMTPLQLTQLFKDRATHLMKSARNGPPHRVWIIYNHDHSHIRDNGRVETRDSLVEAGLDLDTQVLEIPLPGNPNRVATTLANTSGVVDGDAAIILPDPVTSAAKDDIIDWVAKSPLKGWAIYGHGDFTSRGGLMHYGVGRDQMMEDTANVVANYLLYGTLPAPGANQCTYASSMYNPDTLIKSGLNSLPPGYENIQTAPVRAALHPSIRIVG